MMVEYTKAPPTRPSRMMRLLNPLMIVITYHLFLVPFQNSVHGFILQSSSSSPRGTLVSRQRHHQQEQNYHQLQHTAYSNPTTTITVLFANASPTPEEDDTTISITTPPSSSFFREEAESLQAKARQLREEIMLQQQEKRRNPEQTTTTITSSSVANDTIIINSDKSKTTSSLKSNNGPNNVVSSPFTIVRKDNKSDDDHGEYYRLYVDVGREDGTWMDPRWGASGKRIPFTLDVKFVTNRCADPTVSSMMVNDNTMGSTSPVYALETAPFARLRGGFDRMACYGGAYRIDVSNGGRYTLRMVILVEGTKADQNYMYGDVSIPKGGLYFSLPCFGGRISQLSMKEGPVTVRQSGWHTGWRRKESRILGVFNAKPLADAQQRDSF